ncbi:hypothetical protein QJ48_17020 [Paenibacillus sp. A3]|uniref:hypothetical protein n=1 Tax=Paenibacillus sp. A3 TaxID=1337054 RepID=UPI0006D56A78|nr:hypothetical protein [Paenibacillus sp. A3]KPV58364.1 hypothetical protein QJ48_17020 [Paenibacillus sp. A3]
MKTIVKFGTIGTLLLATAFGAVGSAAAETAKDRTAAVPAQKVEGAKMISVHRLSGMLQQPAHERAYLKLLAKTYAPESVEAWNQVLTERQEVEKDMPKPPAMLTVARKDKADSDAKDEAGLSKDAVGKEGRVKIRVLDGVNKENFSSQPLRVEILTDGAAADGQKMIGAALADDIMKAEPSEEMKRQEALAEAAEAGNGEAIRGLLPQLLDDYRKETAELKTMAAKLKAELQKMESK